MVSADGFTRAISGTGPIFILFLIPHIFSGMTALISGAAVIVARKGTRRHVRTGAIYYWAITSLTVTAAGLTAVRGTRDLPVFGLGALAVALASAGRHARRHPDARIWQAWPGHAPHIVAMAASYTVMITAFLSDNARFLPLIALLPRTADWLLPALIATPLIAWSLHRHSRHQAPAAADPPARLRSQP